MGVNVVFVYPDFMRGAGGKYHEGIASMSAVIKQAGHGARLVHVMEELSPADCIKRYRAVLGDADMIGFSATTNAFAFVREMARLAKAQWPRAITVCGGPHATLAPEEVIAAAGIDIVCRGEGEYPLRDLCDAIGRGESYAGIANLWVRNGREVQRNALRPLVEDLDSLPLPDRGIFDYAASADRAMSRLAFLCSRGCPYHCSHCCNHAFSKLLPKTGSYVRFKSVDRVMAELHDALRLADGATEVHFLDDILPLRREWLIALLARFQAEIGKPFICNCRFELVKDDVMAALSAAGCRGLSLGLESGDPVIRRDTLNRRHSEQTITAAVDVIRRRNMSVLLYNMVGLPGETLREALATVKLNARLRPAECQISVFYPYAHTELYDRCRRDGLLNEAATTQSSYFGGDSMLKLPGFPPAEIAHAYRDFGRFVSYYAAAYHGLPRLAGRLLAAGLDLLWMHAGWCRAVFACTRFARRLAGALRRAVPGAGGALRAAHGTELRM